MPPLELIKLNLFSPPILCFGLGIVSVLVRSDLKFPSDLYAALTLYLLLAIGIRGGAELATTPLAVIWKPAVATLLLGVGTTVLAYLVLRRLGRFSVTNAAAIAAHYGSVSVVTFTAAVTFLHAMSVKTEAFLPALVVLMELPAIVVALGIARSGEGSGTPWAAVLHEILAGRSILLLAGGLLIGWLTGEAGMERIKPLFVDPFYGAITLFLLEMGMVAAGRFREVPKGGMFLAGFAVVAPIVQGALGVVVGRACGLSLGGTTVLATLAASASYIAAPAAVRIALPTANPGYYLTAALGITFPFNLTVGIPLYYALARFLYRA